MDEGPAPDSVTARFRYLIGRLRQAPLSVIAAKILARLRPWLWYLPYRLKKSWAKPSSVEHFRSAGRDLRECLDVSPENSRGEHALRGQFECLGYGTATIPSGDAWHTDQFHDYRWARRYFPLCDFAAVDIHADVKVPWELSRLQFLPWLAEAHLRDGQDASEYLTRYRQIVEDWLSHNPVAWGVNWTCPMEVAIRGVNLGLSAAILAADLDDHFVDQVVASLEDHLRFVERFPETSDVNGNHYLADLMGMCLLAMLLHGRDSAKTQRYIGQFASEAQQQFEMEGGHLERAPVYHRLCLDILCVGLAVAVRCKSQLVDELLEMAVRATTFAGNISSATGFLPVIGDCDSGQVLWFGEDARRFDTARQFLNLVADRSDADSPLTGQSRWLVAMAGLDVSEAPSRRGAPRQPATGCASGFAYAHCGELSVTLRAGAQGLRGLASHDHDDTLAVWVSDGARDILVDTGCPSYTLSKQRRERSIVSSAHNVVRPAGRERFEPVQGSVFRNVRGAPVAQLEAHALDDDGGSIAARLQGGVFKSCRRQLRLEHAKLLVDDSWEWAQPEGAEISWLIGPYIDVIANDDTSVRLATKAGDSVGALQFASDLDIDVSVSTRDYSPRYGEVILCQAVTVGMPAHVAGSLTTALMLAT